MIKEQLQASRANYSSILPALNQPLSLPLVMGILNVTPDSFSDGGYYHSTEAALKHALNMIAAGVDIIDVGGESTRPGAIPVSAEEEITRVIPVIEQLSQLTDICIAIDTYKPEVMVAAVAAGATLINDVKALQMDNALATAAQLNVPICLMHMQGTPETMQIKPSYRQNIIVEINHFFTERINACMQAGIALDRLILDPGFGFGKTVQHNLLMIQHLHAFHGHQLPILLGVSRKSTIGQVLQVDTTERLAGSLALSVLAILQDVAILRTHDVKETKQVVQMLNAVDNIGDRYQ